MFHIRELVSYVNINVLLVHIWSFERLLRKPRGNVMCGLELCIAVSGHGGGDCAPVFGCSTQGKVFQETLSPGPEELKGWVSWDESKVYTNVSKLKNYTC